ncbi:MAG TPA: CsiV family protein [Woeseiaceae bacterium]|nr:CsiV family protein [Woeseiaceae bacterium]
MRRLTTTLYMTLLLALAHGQEQGAGEIALQDPPVEARKYAVEIIIFSYNIDDSVGSEVFVPELIEEDDGVPVFSDLEPVEPEPAEHIDEAPDDIELLPADQFSLQEAYGRLSRLQAYKPLMHFGWIQQSVPDAEPVLLDIERFGDRPAELEGTVSLRLSRYLHLAVALSLAANDAQVNEQSDGQSDGQSDTHREQPSAGSGYSDRQYAPLRYTLRQERIMKPGDTRYFDHPKFGVIAKVTRHDES